MYQRMRSRAVEIPISFVPWWIAFEQIIVRVRSITSGECIAHRESEELKQMPVLITFLRRRYTTDSLPSSS